MKLDSYEMQILLIVARNCKPNSPKPDRAWWQPTPLYGVPQFGNALSVLLRDGFLKRRNVYRLKPSPEGYEMIEKWKVYRRELKERPIIFDPVVWKPRIADVVH